MEPHYCFIRYIGAQSKCALQSDIPPKELINQVLNTLEKGSSEKPVKIINKYLSQTTCGNIEAKLLLATGLTHLNLKLQQPTIDETEELLKNVSRLLCASHKSVTSLVEVLVKVLKNSSVSQKVGLLCLLEVLLRTNRTPYNINESAEDLCKRIVQFLSPEVHVKLFVLCTDMIVKSASADVPCVLLAELIKCVPSDVLLGRISDLLAYIACGFCSNVSSVHRSYVYKALVDRIDFSTWEDTVLKLFLKFLGKFRSNDCFMESVKSYFIPMTVLKYRENFYNACRISIGDPTICATSLLYLTKRNPGTLIRYESDVCIFSGDIQNGAVATAGFEMLCNLCVKANFSLEYRLKILDFFYDYRWQDDAEKIARILNRVVISNTAADFAESLLCFAVAAVYSDSRLFVEFGRKLLKVVSPESSEYRAILLKIYMTNSAVAPDFIYDLFEICEMKEIADAMETYLEYRSSRNISHLTKASCIFHAYIKLKSRNGMDGRSDSELVLLNVKKKLNNIEARSFQDGSILFFIKTAKLLYEDQMIVEDTFDLLSKSVRVLLTNDVITKLLSVDERKLYESLLSEILECMFLISSNPAEPKARSPELLNACVLVIQTANMRQPVTTASLILQKASRKFGTFETLSRLADKCFASLKADMRASTIRCSAEQRLVLESVCAAGNSASVTKAVLSRLLGQTRDAGASQRSREACLHTLEALLSNKSLQNVTRGYAEEIAETILEGDQIWSFGTRNATVQVWRTLVNVLRGQTDRTGAAVERLFLAHRRLPYIFYAAVVRGGRVVVDERCLLVLATFIECQQGMHFLKPDLEKIVEPFMAIFGHLVLNHAGYHGKFAVAAYTAQCPPQCIISVLQDITAFLGVNGKFLPSGILANVTYLMSLLVAKYRTYFKDSDGLAKILCTYENCLRKLNFYGSAKQLSPLNSIYAFVPYLIRKDCKTAEFHRFWVQEMGWVEFTALLKKYLNCSLPVRWHVFLLSVSLQKLCQKRPQDQQFAIEVVHVLIANFINLESKSNYLLLSYAQTIFFIYEKIGDFHLDGLNLIEIAHLSRYSLYHFSIFPLIIPQGTGMPAKVSQELFHQYRKILLIEDPDTLSFFASTLPFVYSCAKTGAEKSTVFKIAVVLMLCGDTDTEFCKFIASINRSELMNLMCSAREMLSFKNLMRHLNDERLVFQFLVDVSVYVSQSTGESDAFYSVDTNSQLLPVSAVKRLLFKSFSDLYDSM